MDYKTISKALYLKADKKDFHLYVELETKHKGYITAIIWLQKHDPTKIMSGICTEAYSEYMFWCDENDLPFITQHRFTTYLAKYHHIFIKNTRIDGQVHRAYYRADTCPTCKRPFGT